MSYPDKPNEIGYYPVCGVLAWVLPGLGHMARGEKKRGGYIMFGVLFLFLSGVLIGGVDSVDRKEDRLWYLAQTCCGPVALVVDFVNQQYLKTGAIGEIVSTQPAPINIKKSLGRANEYGTLFSSLAGLMNLVVILDAFHPRPRKRHERRHADSARTAQGASAA